jgi:CheY-like chemotaxis protein
MGGELSLQSASGEGSCFSFTLAFKPAPRLPGSPASILRSPYERKTSQRQSVAIIGQADSKEEIPGLDGRPSTQLRIKRELHLRCLADTTIPARILIVDDSLLNCKLLSRSLMRAAKLLGIAPPTIQTALNGQIAVSMIAAALVSPDTIDPERGGSPSAPFNLVCLVHFSLLSHPFLFCLSSAMILLSLLSFSNFSRLLYVNFFLPSRLSHFDLVDSVFYIHCVHSYTGPPNACDGRSGI